MEKGIRKGGNADISSRISNLSKLPPQALLHLRNKGGENNWFLEDQVSDKNLTDLDIICRDGYMSVHRCLLMGASTFFRDLLIDKNIRDTCAITVPDITIREMAQMMELVYTGQTIISTDKDETDLFNMNLNMFGFNDLPILVNTNADIEELQKQAWMTMFLKSESSSDYLRCHTDILRGKKEEAFEVEDPEMDQLLMSDHLGEPFNTSSDDKICEETCFQNQEQDHNEASAATMMNRIETEANAMNTKETTDNSEKIEIPSSPSKSSRIEENDPRSNTNMIIETDLRLQESENRLRESILESLNKNDREVQLGEPEREPASSVEEIVIDSDSDTNDLVEGESGTSQGNDARKTSSNHNDTVEIIDDSEEEVREDHATIFKDPNPEFWKFHRNNRHKLNMKKNELDFLGNLVGMEWFTPRSVDQRNISTGISSSSIRKSPNCDDSRTLESGDPGLSKRDEKLVVDLTDDTEEDGAHTLHLGSSPVASSSSDCNSRSNCASYLHRDRKLEMEEESSHRKKRRRKNFSSCTQIKSGACQPE